MNKLCGRSRRNNFSRNVFCRVRVTNLEVKRQQQQKIQNVYQHLSLSLGPSLCLLFHESNESEEKKRTGMRDRCSGGVTKRKTTVLRFSLRLSSLRSYLVVSPTNSIISILESVLPFFFISVSPSHLIKTDIYNQP